jgi:hypothetical protein
VSGGWDESRVGRRGAIIGDVAFDLDALLEPEQWAVVQIEPTVKQIASLEGDLRVARLKTLAAGRALLTPQQLEKLKHVGHHMRSMEGPDGMGHGMMGHGAPGTPGRGGPPAQRHTH